MEFQRTLICLGPKRRDGESWSVPHGRNPVDDTRCNYCRYWNIGGLSAHNSTLFPAGKLHRANCDSVFDLSLSQIKQGGVAISVEEPTSGAPSYIVKTTEGTDYPGVGQVQMSPSQDFRVVIDASSMNRGNTNRRRITHYQVVSLKIGDKDVTVGRDAYGNPLFRRLDQKAYFNGFTDDSNDSFKYQASTRDGRLGEPESDGTGVIRVNVQGYHCETYVPEPEPVYRSGTTRGGGTKGVGSSCTGGRTVSGGQSVQSHQYHTTRDQFFAEGEPVGLTLQMVCRETDDVIQSVHQCDNVLQELDAEAKVLKDAFAVQKRAHEAELADIDTRRKRARLNVQNLLSSTLQEPVTQPLSTHEQQATQLWNL